MKNIIIAVIIAFFAVTTVQAASNVYKTNVKWGEVKTPDQISDVYQLADTANGTVCYFVYTKRDPEATPSVDCVKVK